ncbi:MAG: hypothetical protein ACP5OA_03670 [Candidatus Woesearchaeota archaeon]
MNTKNMLKTGLCTIILACSSILSGQNVNKDVPKSKLEVITEQGAYISPEGNYSIRHNPKGYGLTLPKHVSYNGGYRDSYTSLPGQMQGVLVIESITAQTDNLRQIYDQYAKGYITAMYNSLSEGLRSGQKLNTINSPIQSTVIDNNPAIRGGVKLVVIDANNVTALGMDLIVTLAKGKNKLYGFVYSYPNFKDSELQANAIYGDVLNSFRALK